MRAMLLLIPAMAFGMGTWQPVASQSKATGAPSSPAREPTARITLRANDLAPSIAAEVWMNGSAVPRFEAGKVYIVEFWATWCSPCVRNIPHLNELQKKYPAVTVIGVAASEPPARFGLPDRRLPTLQKFVAEKGDGMSYRIAYDSKPDVYDAWMTASGNSTIPKTFLVSTDGRIAWIGHPDDVEAELEKVLATQRTKVTPQSVPSKLSDAPPSRRLRPLP